MNNVQKKRGKEIDRTQWSGFVVYHQQDATF